MNRNGYSAGGVKLSFWFMEFRKTVSLLDEGKDWDAIKQLAVDENIYGCPTTARAKQIFTTVSARIKCLDPSFYQIFLTSDVSSQKLFALAAAMLQDTLFFDFVYEVVREKMILGMNEFSQSDISIFFKDKAMQDAKVAEWTDATLVRLGRYYKTMLFEAGMTEKGKDFHKINKPILDPLMSRWLEDYDMMPIVKAFTGVR